MNEHIHINSAESEELFALYTMYCAIARVRGKEKDYEAMQYRQFTQFWNGMDPQSRQSKEERLRADYKQLLNDSVDSGMNVVKKYLKAEKPKVGGRFLL